MKFSAVTCCYNPDDRILEEVLNAIENLSISYPFSFEHFIVDNNSQPPLSERNYVSRYINKNSYSTLIIEKKQGLTESRLAGFRASSGEVIIFFDDDNVPEASYVDNAYTLFKEHPEVGIWGPGIVKAVFEAGIDLWIAEHTRGIFQEKYTKNTLFACDPKSTSNPLGTGMVVKREILEKYEKNFRAGNYSNSDRNGNSLSTGGDIQIVYNAIKNNVSCGTSPMLKMEHHIPLKRTKMPYLTKLVYGYGNSAYTAYTEVFPEQVETVPIPEFKKVFLTLAIKLFQVPRGYYPFRYFKLDMADLTGKTSSAFKARNIKEPSWVNCLRIILNINN